MIVRHYFFSEKQLKVLLNQSNFYWNYVCDGNGDWHLFTEVSSHPDRHSFDDTVKVAEWPTSMIDDNVVKSFKSFDDAQKEQGLPTTGYDCLSKARRYLNR